jgi:hypothetical protein
MGRVEEAYAALAARQGWNPHPAQGVVPLTPLLAKGGVFDPAYSGTMPGGFEGRIGRLTYRGNEGSGTFRFNVVHTRVDESQTIVPRLFCIRRGRWTDNVHYGMEIRHSQLWTESERLNERFKVESSPYQDPIWMRRLFSPVFIDWLAAAFPHDFSWELAYGDLVGSIEQDDPDERTLVGLCEATGYVAARIRQECLQTNLGPA